MHPIRPVVPGRFVAAAGADIALGETVLRRGHLLTSREIGMLPAVGMAQAPVWRQPIVAIFSTGDEIVAPGGPIQPGQVYDSNAAILAAAVRELGCTPLSLGIVPDDATSLDATLRRALAQADAVLLSGGTSKGAGDLAAGVVGKPDDPGIVVHGAALKPGKPLCLAVSAGKPVAILPGFPTSAIFTFHDLSPQCCARCQASRRRARKPSPPPCRCASARSVAAPNTCWRRYFARRLAAWTG